MTHACIVGGGPSIHETVDELKSLVSEGVDLICVNHAHDWVIEHGMTPKYTIFPEVTHIFKIKKTIPECTYIIRSDASEGVKKSVEGGNIQTYHKEFLNGIPYNTFPRLSRLAVLNVAYHLGYRKFDLFGFDCSAKPDGNTHFDGDHERSHDFRAVAIEDEVFLSNSTWKQHYEYIIATIGAGVIDITVHGKSLLSTLCQKPHLLKKGINRINDAVEQRGLELWWKERPLSYSEAVEFVKGFSIKGDSDK